MPLQNDTIEQKKFPVFDEGHYQVEITDIEEAQGTNFNTDEPETRYLLHLLILEPKEVAGQELRLYTSTKYSPAREGRKESKLYTVVTKAMGKAIPAADLHLNDLIGKQLIVTLEKYTNDSGYERNKISGFISAKVQLEKPKVTDKTSTETSDTPPTSVLEREAEKNAPKQEELDWSDIPF